MSLRVYTRNFAADFLQVKCTSDGKRPFCIVEPPLGDLGATYAVHLRLIGKFIVDSSISDK